MHPWPFRILKGWSRTHSLEVWKVWRIVLRWIDKSTMDLSSTSQISHPQSLSFYILILSNSVLQSFQSFQSSDNLLYPCEYCYHWIQSVVKLNFRNISTIFLRVDSEAGAKRTFCRDRILPKSASEYILRMLSRLNVKPGTHFAELATKKRENRDKLYSIRALNFLIIDTADTHSTH